MQETRPVPRTSRLLAAEHACRGQRPSEPEVIDANAVLSMAEQPCLEKLHQQDQKEINQLKYDLPRKGKALAEAAALLIAAKKSRPSLERTGRTDDPGRSPEGP